MDTYIEPLSPTATLTTVVRPLSANAKGYTPDGMTDEAVKQQLLQLEADFAAGRITEKGYHDYRSEILRRQGGPPHVLPGSNSPIHGHSKSSPSGSSSNTRSSSRSHGHSHSPSSSKYSMLSNLRPNGNGSAHHHHHPADEGDEEEQEQEEEELPPPPSALLKERPSPRSPRQQHHLHPDHQDQRQRSGSARSRQSGRAGGGASSVTDSRSRGGSAGSGSNSSVSFGTAIGSNGAALDVPRLNGFDVQVAAEETVDQVWDEQHDDDDDDANDDGCATMYDRAETMLVRDRGDSDAGMAGKRGASKRSQRRSQSPARQMDVYTAFSSVRPPPSPSRKTRDTVHYEPMPTSPHKGAEELYAQPEIDEAMHQQWQQYSPAPIFLDDDFLPPPPPPPAPPARGRGRATTADDKHGLQHEYVDVGAFTASPPRGGEVRRSKKSSKHRSSKKKKKQKKGSKHDQQSDSEYGGDAMYERPVPGVRGPDIMHHPVSNGGSASTGGGVLSDTQQSMRRRSMLKHNNKVLSYRPNPGHVERVQRILQEQAQMRGRVPRERYTTLTRPEESEATRFLAQLRKAKRTVLPFNQRALESTTVTAADAGISPHGRFTPFGESTASIPESTDSIDLASATTFAESLALRYSYVPNSPAISVQTFGGKACHAYTWKTLRKEARAVSEVLQHALAAARSRSPTMASGLAGVSTRSQPQHHVALVFDTNNPASVGHMAVAFHGAAMSGAVPVPLAFPSTEDTASTDMRVRSMGFVMSSCNISAVVSDLATRKVLDEACHGAINKGPLPKGWPDVKWMFVDRLPRAKKTRQRGVHVSSRQDAAFALPDLSVYNDIKTVTVSHESVFAQAAAFKSSLSLSQSNQVSVVVDLSTGPGIWTALINGATCGFETVVIPSHTIAKKPKQTWAHLEKASRADAVVMVDVPGLKALTGTREAIDAFAGHIADVGRIIILVDNVVQRDVVKCVKALIHKGLPQQRVAVALYSATGNFIMTGPLAQFRTDGEHVHLSCVLPAPGLEPSMNVGLALSRPVGNAFVGVVRLHDHEPCVETEQGEIVISSETAASGFVGLQMQSTNTFAVTVPGTSESQAFTRTGLLGSITLKSDGKPEVVVTGLRRDLMLVEGLSLLRMGIENTITACQEKYKLELPMSGRDAAVFVDSVAGANRLVIVLETAFDVLNETDPKDVDTTLQKVAAYIERYNQVRPFAMLLVADGILPRNIHGRVDSDLCAELYQVARIDALHVCVDSLSCLPDLEEQTNPEAIERRRSIGILPALDAEPSQLSQIEGVPIHLEKKLAAANTILSLLVKKLRRTPDTPIFTFVDAKGKRLAVSPKMLMARARQIAHSLQSANVTNKDVVLVVVPASPDLVASFYACLILGAVPIVLSAAATRDDVPGMMPVWQSVAGAMRAAAILTTQKHHQCVKAAAKEELRQLDLQFVFADAKHSKEYTGMHTPEDRKETAFVEYTISSSGLLTGVEVSHLNMLALGQAFKNELSMEDTHTILAHVDPTCGVGLASWMYLHLIVDHPFLLVSNASNVNPLLWLHLVAKLDVEVAICTHRTLFASMQQFLRQPPQLDKGLSCLSRCLVLCRDRPWTALMSYFEAAFRLLQLRRGVLCPVLETRPNAFVSVAVRQMEREQTFVDLLQLSRDKLQLLERGSTSEACVWSLGPPVPGTKVAVLQADKNALCGAQQIGEICVSSPHNVKRYTGIDHKALREVNRKLLAANLPGRDEAYARTGLFGFFHDGQIYVVGNREDDMVQRTLRHHPVDLEDTIERAFPFVQMGGCAVLSMQEYVVVAVEAQELEQPVLGVAPRIIAMCMTKHRVLVNAVMFLRPGTIPMDASGAKQRQLLKEMITSGQLMPPHVILNHVET